MRKLARLVVLIAILFASLLGGATKTTHIAVAAIQATYFASPTGSGSLCSFASPCALTSAQAKVRSVTGNMYGDIFVYLRGGTYTLSQTLVLSSTLGDAGTNGYNVIYEAYPGDDLPVLSGGRTITGWTLHDPGKNIWQASVANLQTRQLYVNGVRAVRARGKPVMVTGTTQTGLTVDSTAMNGWGNQSDIEFVFPNTGSWYEHRCGVASISGTTITMKQPCWGNTTDRSGEVNFADSAIISLTQIVSSTLQYYQPNIYVENAYELLAQPGQWYYDRTAQVLYYIPRPGESITSATVVAPVLETLVSGTGTLTNPLQNVEFKGIAFEYATWLAPNGNDGLSDMQADFTLTGMNAGHAGQGGCTYGGNGGNPPPSGTCPFMNWTKTPANVTFHAAHNILLERDIFMHLGGTGLGFEYGSQNNIVRGCVFTDISANGIQIGDAYDAEPPGGDTREINAGNQLVDNYMHDFPVEYHGGVAIWQGYTQDSLIAHNDIERTPYSAISSGWGQGQDSSVTPNVNRRNHITHNLIVSAMNYLEDGGAIYTEAQQGTTMTDGMTIDYNVVRGLLTAPATGQLTLYTDAGSEYITLQHNVLYHNNPLDFGGCNTFGAGRRGNDIAYLTFQNNYWQNTDTGLWCGPPLPSGLIIQNNTVISDLSQVPTDILNNAGLESAYQDIRGPLPTTVDDGMQGTGLNQFNYCNAGGSVCGASSNWYHCATSVSGCTGTGGGDDTMSWDNVTNDYVTMQFTGTQFKYYTCTGTDGGIVAVSIDGGPETMVDDYASVTPATCGLMWTSPVLAPGTHSFKLRVTGTKNQNSTGYFAGLDRADIVPTFTTVDDGVQGTGLNQFNYCNAGGSVCGASSNWYHCATSVSGCTGTGGGDDTMSWDNVTNDYVTMQFTGRQIRYYTSTGNDGGIVAVSIDGGPETMVDDYEPTSTLGQLMWISPVLSMGTHTFTLRVTGTHDSTGSSNYFGGIDRVDIVS